MSYPVKNYNSTQTGLTTLLSGTAGSRIAVLDACLINGFNSKTVTITRSGTTATVTDTAHGRVTGDIVLFSGADQADYNGEAKITVVNANSYTYQVANSPATPATGTITAKTAPAGSWSKIWSSSNKAAYKSADVAATGCVLYVDDTNALYATVKAYETFTDESTNSGLFGTAYWHGSSTSNSTARNFCLYADSRLFYFFAAWHASYLTQYDGAAFGDIVTFKAGDLYHCVLMGQTSNAPSYPYTNSGFSIKNNGSQAGQFLARSYSQLGSGLSFLKNGLGFGNSTSYFGAHGAPFPNGPDNGFHVRYPIDIYETSYSGNLRGYMPGFYDPQHPNPLNHLDTVSNVVNLTGRTLQIVKLGNGSGTQNAALAIDITGPWR